MIDVVNTEASNREASRELSHEKPGETDAKPNYCETDGRENESLRV